MTSRTERQTSVDGNGTAARAWTGTEDICARCCSNGVDVPKNACGRRVGIADRTVDVMHVSGRVHTLIIARLGTVGTDIVDNGLNRCQSRGYHWNVRIVVDTDCGLLTLAGLAATVLIHPVDDHVG